MLTTADRLARARIEAGGGVHALLIGTLDRDDHYQIGRDADKVIAQLKLEIAALKHQLEVARTVREARQ
jgi:hypothetical protein